MPFGDRAGANAIPVGYLGDGLYPRPTIAVASRLTFGTLGSVVYAICLDATCFVASKLLNHYVYLDWSDIEWGSEFVFVVSQVGPQ